MKVKTKLAEEKKKMDDDQDIVQVDDRGEITEDDNDKVVVTKEKEGEVVEVDGTTVLPQDYVCPDVACDGKWYPPGYPTFFCYV